MSTPALAEVVAEYTFEGGTAQDNSDHGHDGTIMGAPATVPGFDGDALSFDGLDDYVVVADHADLEPSVFSITVWLRIDSVPDIDTTVLAKWEDDRGYRLIIGAGTGVVQFELGDGSGEVHVVDAPFRVFDDAWTTVTVTYDGVALRLYMDGSIVREVDADAVLADNDADLIMAASATQGELFAGALDAVVIENTAVSDPDACAGALKLWHESSATCIDGFTDVTDQFGLGDEGHRHFGICMVDVNDDGWIDLYYANGTANPDLPDEPVDGVCPELDEPPVFDEQNYNVFYLNLGNGDGFSPDIAPEIGIDDPWNAMRNVWGDYDNDGRRDLMSHNFLVSPLYRAVSGPDPLLFEDVSVATGLEICIIHGTGASWVDVNNDGWLDMYATEYGLGVPAEELTNPMYINNGDGTFTEITVEAGVDQANNPMGITFVDYDNDGDQDVYLSNSPPTPTRLYRNDGVNPDTGLPHFTDVAVEAGVAVNDSSENLGFGVAWGDYNNDGRFDLLFLRQYDSRLWRNDGPDEFGVWSFTDVTGEGGLVMAPYQFEDGNFADLDNDGWLDLVMANNAASGPNQVFLNNRDETWREVSELIGMDFTDRKHRGVVAGDLDNDGDLEVALLARSVGQPNTLLHSEARGNNWIQFDLEGTTSNRDAVGARITTTAAPQAGEPAFEQIREVTAGTGFFSDMPRIQTVGLGKASIVSEVRIDWPSGEQLTLVNVPINQRLEILEGDPPPDPIVTTLSISGPATVTGNATHSFLANAEYYYSAPGDETANAAWSVEPGDFAEFTAPGELTVSAVPSNQTVVITASLSGFEASMSLLIQPADVVDTSPPTLTVAQGGNITTEEATVVINGTAADDLGVVVSVMWSNDHGASGPCAGLLEWSTGPIALAIGANAITVRATDNADNKSSTLIMVERIEVEPEPEDPIDEDPSDPDEPSTPDEDEPVGTDEPPSTDDDEIDDSDTPDEVTDTPDVTDDDEPTPDSPVPDGGMDTDSSTDGGRSNPTGICGGIGAINLGVMMLGICALRRRRVGAER